MIVRAALQNSHAIVGAVSAVSGAVLLAAFTVCRSGRAASSSRRHHRELALRIGGPRWQVLVSSR